MRFRPLHDRVLAQRLEEEELSAGGIFIPDAAREKPMEARIFAVGPGAVGKDGTILSMSVNVGDRILIGKWSWPCENSLSCRGLSDRLVTQPDFVQFYARRPPHGP